MVKCVKWSSFKDNIPQDLVPGTFYKWTRGRCNSSHCDKTDWNLKVISDHTGILPSTLKVIIESFIQKNRLECKSHHPFNESAALAMGIKSIYLNWKKPFNQA